MASLLSIWLLFRQYKKHKDEKRTTTLFSKKQGKRRFYTNTCGRLFSSSIFLFIIANIQTYNLNTSFQLAMIFYPVQYSKTVVGVWWMSNYMRINTIGFLILPFFLSGNAAVVRILPRRWTHANHDNDAPSWVLLLHSCISVSVGYDSKQRAYKGASESGFHLQHYSSSVCDWIRDGSTDAPSDDRTLPVL